MSCQVCIDDLLKLQKNLQVMRVLCNHFLPSVNGKMQWKMQILAGKKVNKIATVLAEAFVLLVLENIWDDMMNVNINDYYHPKKRKKANDAKINESYTKANSPAVSTDNNINHNQKVVITGQWTSA